VWSRRRCDTAKRRLILTSSQAILAHVYKSLISLCYCVLFCAHKSFQILINGLVIYSSAGVVVSEQVVRSAAWRRSSTCQGISAWWCTTWRSVLWGAGRSATWRHASRSLLLLACRRCLLLGCRSLLRRLGVRIAHGPLLLLLLHSWVRSLVLGTLWLRVVFGVKLHLSEFLSEFAIGTVHSGGCNIWISLNDLQCTSKHINGCTELLSALSHTSGLTKHTSNSLVTVNSVP